jgi:hypothetical protein
MCEASPLSLSDIQGILKERSMKKDLDAFEKK